MKGKRLMLIRTMIVSVSVTAVVALGTPAQAALRPASARATRAALVTTTIKVTTGKGNSRFILSSRTAPRGVVIFKFTNTARFRHDFSIKGRTTRLLSQGESAILRVTFLRKGRYPYKCTFDHHASWGQKGVFTIT
jgi:plastocyanin